MDEEQEPKAKKAMDEAEGEENKLTKAKPSKSKLSEDVIYGIAEQMFFKKPFSNKGISEIDLTKQNPYTIFMGHCQVHLNAMMAQFAKLKRIEFRKFNGKDLVCFYKHKESSSGNYSNLDIKDAFSGPYRVTKPMAFGVIEYGKLRVSAVRTYYYLKKTVPSAENDQIRQQKRPIQAFSALFLNNNMSDSEDIAQNYVLNIERLEVNERADVIEANLRSLLALDSVEIELNPEAVFDHTRADSIFFGGCSSQSNCCATRTKKISVNAGISLKKSLSPIGAADFASFGAKWCRQVRSLVNCCPRLEQLAFQLQIDFPFLLAPEHILQHVGTVVRAARNLLEQLDGGGSEQLRVSVDFTATCGYPNLGGYQRSVQILRSLDNNEEEEHEQLFTLGTPFVFDDYEKMGKPYIARSLTIVDATGRRSHLFKFKVYERMQTARKCVSVVQIHPAAVAALHFGQADLDSSSSDSAAESNPDEDEEEEDEQENDDEDDEQPVAGTSKAAQNDDAEEGKEEEEGEEEPGKKRARLI